MMTEPQLVTTVAGGVGRLRLNRPDKRNAITTELGAHEGARGNGCRNSSKPTCGGTTN